MQQPDDLPPEERLTRALAACQQSGDRWDPKLVETLTLLVSGLRQGFSLSVSTPKISAGLWLIDAHCADDLLAAPAPASLSEQYQS